MKQNFLKKTLIALLGTVTALSLVSCGGNGPSASAGSTSAASSTSTSFENSVVLKVGASPSPHAEILNFVKDQLTEQGIDLQVVEFTDYVLPNKSLEAGEIDANYFQHQPYLDDFNEKEGANLVGAVKVHFEPFGIYPGKTASLDELKDGAEIAVPNDTTNEARALQLLEAQGLIKLKEGVGLEATVRDITENPKNLKITELPAEQLSRALSDVDFAIINGNYALSAGLSGKALVTEGTDTPAKDRFQNVLAVRGGDENREEIKALIAALTSEETREYLEKTYPGVVIPVF